MDITRQTFYSTEVYSIARGLGLPITRSLLHVYRKKHKFTPVAKHFQMFIYSREDVISLLKFVSEYRNAKVTEQDIRAYLRLNYDQAAPAV